MHCAWLSTLRRAAAATSRTSARDQVPRVEAPARAGARRHLRRQSGARPALDLFTGTTRVAQEFKRRGMHVTAVDSARYAEVFAQCYVAIDGAAVDRARARGRARATSRRAPASTATSPRRSACSRGSSSRTTAGASTRSATRSSATTADSLAVPGAAHEPHRGGRPGRLHDRRADGVREAVGAALVPAARAARARAARRARASPSRADACDAGARRSGPFDLAYLDPPYNQHRYFTNYHIWETLVAWDAPEHYGVACKRVDARDPATQERVQRAAAHAATRSRA